MEKKKVSEIIKTLRIEIAKEGPEKLIEKAYCLAEKHHGGQKRASGENYIIHPIIVADKLWQKYHDPKLTIAGLLHDTVEDCPDIDIEFVYHMFGDEIGFLVDAVTKNRYGFFQNEKEFRDRTERLLWAGMQDVRVLLLKLADREHNIETLEYLKSKKQVRISFETQAIYTPLKNILEENACPLSIAGAEKRLATYLRKKKIHEPRAFKESLLGEYYERFTSELFNDIYKLSNEVLWEIDDLNYLEGIAKDPTVSSGIELVSIHSGEGREYAVFQFKQAGNIGNNSTKLSPHSFQS